MTRRSPPATKAEPRIVLTDDTVPPVILTDDTVSPVALDADGIAHAIGADHTEPSPPGGGSPVTWYAVREEAARRLRSTGGRPGLPGGELRKVAVTDQDWRMVRDLAESIAEPGFHPSAGQVAGVLLSHALHEAHRSLPKPTQPVRQKSVSA